MESGLGVLNNSGIAKYFHKEAKADEAIKMWQQTGTYNESL